MPLSKRRLCCIPFFTASIIEIETEMVQGRVTDSGNEHRVDALEFTSIPCNLKMQIHTSRTVIHVFDTLVKELCDLEKTVLTMGEGVYEVILRITDGSRVFHPIPAVFFTHTPFVSCFCIASCR